MSRESRLGVRNVAIVAHVDHGKTTLMDALLWQTDALADPEGGRERLHDLLGSDREKSVTVMAKNTAIDYRGVRINVVDTPGHADFGGEVERTLKMADGVLLLIDAGEGPLPQNRYVLRKALESGLAPIVVINKIDLPDARPLEVLEEVRELFLDLDAAPEQRRFPVLYTNALRGTCRTAPDGEDRSMEPLLDAILETVPAPTFDPSEGLKALVTNLDYDDYLGRMAICRVYAGRLEPGRTVAHCRRDGGHGRAVVQGLFGYDGPRSVEIESAEPGDIVAVTGIEAVRIGETLADPERPEPLPPLRVDEPTLHVVVSVNDSPLAGLEGRFVSPGKLRERLYKELLGNVSIRVEETDSPEAFTIAGRGELQLAILLEMLRREGVEMSVGRPAVRTREVDGAVHEPFELLVVDCPDAHVGVVTEKVSARKGRMTRMVNHGTGRVRLEFHIPSRGLVGFRSEFLSDTRGAGVMTQLFDGFGPWQGDIPHRSTGSLVADRPGRATAHAIEHLQPRGTIFVAPGDQVYEGMIVGENTRALDVEVNVCKEAKPAPWSPGPSAPSVRLRPPRTMSLEQAIEFIRDDERVEVTPRALRLRKSVLPRERRPQKS